MKRITKRMQWDKAQSERQFSLKGTLSGPYQEAIFGQERTPSSFVIICYRVNFLIIQLLCDLPVHIHLDEALMPTLQ